MRILSVTCDREDVVQYNKNILSIPGITLIRYIPLKETNRFSGNEYLTGEVIILFAVTDVEAETILSLKYPPGTFTERMV